MHLKGKTMFITGAAQGLGRAYTEAMLEKGAKVFFGDVNEIAGASTAQEFAARFGAENVKFVPLDVTKKERFTEVFKQAVSMFGGIDIMVNNAGLMDESRIDLMIALNFAAVVQGTNLAVEHMRKDKGGRGGRIINISSAVGLMDTPMTPVYGATKHAVRSFTAALAIQPHKEDLGIEYSILCPNPAATDLILKADSSKVLFFDQIKEQMDALTMPVSTVVNAFMNLLHLEKMNGAILFVSKDKMEYKKMEAITVEDPSTTSS